LQRMMALYVASHYKNQPNDLQLLSDAPTHHLFVLLPPMKGDEITLPEPLVVLQVAMEGRMSRSVVMDGLGRGVRTDGDMIPWIVARGPSGPNRCPCRLCERKFSFTISAFADSL